MTELYLLENCDVYKKLKNLLSRHIPARFEILRTKNGKPYIDGDPVYFSLSHSGDKAVIAISHVSVGVDLELERNLEYLHILSRFSARERAEIRDNSSFLAHWVAREAYIKMVGSTIWEGFKNTEFFGGDIYCGGVKQACRITLHKLNYGIAAVCEKI